MYNLLIAIKHKLIVQSRYKPQKTKMQKNTQTFLDGSEKSMVHALKQGYSALSVATEGMTLLEEFSAGTGIADLVFVGSEKKRLLRRAKMKIPAITSLKELELISVIDGNTASEEEISKRIGKSRDYTQRILEELLRKQVVAKKSTGFITRLSPSDCTISKSIAIEAKVKDWKSGIKQALRYKEFADYSYLALYEKHSRVCLQREDMIRGLGIGLLVVSEDGTVREAIKPSPNSAIDEVRHLLASERYFSIVDETQQAFVVRNFFAS